MKSDLDYDLVFALFANKTFFCREQQNVCIYMSIHTHACFAKATLWSLEWALCFSSVSHVLKALRHTCEQPRLCVEKDTNINSNTTHPAHRLFAHWISGCCRARCSFRFHGKQFLVESSIFGSQALLEISALLFGSLTHKSMQRFVLLCRVLTSQDHKHTQDDALAYCLHLFYLHPPSPPTHAHTPTHARRIPNQELFLFLRLTLHLSADALGVRLLHPCFGPRVALRIGQ